MRIRVSRKPHVPVTLEEEGPDGKLEVYEYTIREMMGPTRSAYMKALADGIKFDAKKQKLTRTDDDQSTLLISLCLYDDKEKLVDREVIAKWSQSSILALFELCQQQNGMTTDSEEEEKKDSTEKKKSGSELPNG
jgi:hypothetical protein